MKPQLIIVRGIAGSGKSTFAAELSRETGLPVLESDKYFIRDGVYQFDVEKLSAAHAWCRQRIYENVYVGDGAIVSNCEIRWRDMKVLLSLAWDTGSEVHVVDMLGRFESVHDVPEFRMARKRQGWRDFQALVPFMLRDGYPTTLVSTYTRVEWVDGVRKITYPAIDYGVAPAKKT